MLTPRAPRRPPLSTRPPRSPFVQETGEKTEGLLQKVLSQGHPSTLSVVQAIGMEEQFNFVHDENQVAFHMMGFAGKGPGLASSSKRVGVYEKDAAKLKEHVHVLKGSARDHIREKQDEIKAVEE